MQADEGGDTRIGRMTGGSLAVADLNTGSSKASETDMHIPHGGSTLLAGGVGGIPLDNNSAKVDASATVPANIFMTHPAEPLRAEKTISEISVVPLSPGLPTM